MNYTTYIVKLNGFEVRAYQYFQTLMLLNPPPPGLIAATTYAGVDVNGEDIMETIGYLRVHDEGGYEVPVGWWIVGPLPDGTYTTMSRMTFQKLIIDNNPDLFREPSK